MKAISFMREWIDQPLNRSAMRVTSAVNRFRHAAAAGTDSQLIAAEIHHHAISWRSRQNAPLGRSAWVANQTTVSAPCSAVLVAPAPPMSV